MTSPPSPEQGKTRKIKGWYVAGGVAAALAGVAGVAWMAWDWNWVRPLAQSRVSAVLGRQVRMDSMEVRPGRVTTIVLHGVHIANPPGFTEPDFAQIDTLTIVFEAATWYHTRKIVLPRVDLEKPGIVLARNADGQNNWTFPALTSGSGAGAAPEIGGFFVTNGTVHMRAEKPAATSSFTMASLEARPDNDATLIVTRDIRMANPDGFTGPDLATIPALTMTLQMGTLISTGKVVLPRIEIEKPVLNLIQTAAGHENWIFPSLGSGSSPGSGAGDGPGPEIGDLSITAGKAHLRMASPAADVALTFATGGKTGERTLVVDAKGVYDRQPVTVHAVGGSLLRLRDSGKPYPLDITAANGPTHVTLKGSVRDPLSLAGADLALSVSGPDMELLYPLTGIPIPKTPPYAFSGKVTFPGKKLHLTEIRGRIGSSDITGALELDRAGARPLLSGDLESRHVDMKDLAGFIGAEPGRVTTPGQTRAQAQRIQQAEASPKLLPTRRISIPRLLASDVHLHYKGDKIINGDLPFDAIDTMLDIHTGRIRLDPMRLGVGGGAVIGHIDLNPSGDALDADVDVTMRQVNLGDLLTKWGLGSGQGLIDGAARLKGHGASMAAIVGQGEGALRIVMAQGGQVNALLVDLSGFEIASALLAALGVPKQEAIHCMIGDFVLHHGIMASRTLLVDTTGHLISGGGRADLTNELLDLRIRTDVKHFTIGKLASPIAIFGPFKHLQFGIDAELLARGAAAAGLSVVFPAAAILPTIQFGVGDNTPCAPRSR